MIRDAYYLIRAIIVMRRLARDVPHPFRKEPDWMVRMAVELAQDESPFLRRYTREARREFGLRQSGFR